MFLIFTSQVAQGEESACQFRRHKRHGFNPWVRKIPWRSKQQPLLFLPGKSYGQRNLVGYSPWGHKESDMSERLIMHTHITAFFNLCHSYISGWQVSWWLTGLGWSQLEWLGSVHHGLSSSLSLAWTCFHTKEKFKRKSIRLQGFLPPRLRTGTSLFLLDCVGQSKAQVVLCCA